MIIIKLWAPYHNISLDILSFFCEEKAPSLKKDRKMIVRSFKNPIQESLKGQHLVNLFWVIAGRSISKSCDENKSSADYFLLFSQKTICAATTFSEMTLSIMTVSITRISINHHYNNQRDENQYNQNQDNGTQHNEDQHQSAL